jgi:hypothetical protein
MKSADLYRAISSRPTLWIPVVLAAVSLLSLAFVAAADQGRCRHVQGRLVDGSRFIGTISGDYTIADIPYAGDCPDEPAGDVTCTVAFSTVSGSRGAIDLVEYGTLDFEEQEGTNGAVLMLVLGGTGQWEAASGHVVLSGYFHTDGSESNWRYQGEVCTP